MIPLLKKYYSTRDAVEKLMDFKSIVSLEVGELKEMEGMDEVHREQDRWAFRNSWRQSRDVSYYYIFTKQDEWECESKEPMSFDSITIN